MPRPVSELPKLTSMPSPKLGAGICGSSQVKKKKMQKKQQTNNGCYKSCFYIFFFFKPNGHIIGIAAYKATG